MAICRYGTCKAKQRDTPPPRFRSKPILGWGSATLAASGSRIRIGSKVVRLQAQIENDERADTKARIGLRVDVFVDEVLQPLTYGSVGIGNEAIAHSETAVLMASSRPQRAFQL